MNFTRNFGFFMETLLLPGDYFGPFSARGPQKVGPTRGLARPVRISNMYCNITFALDIKFSFSRKTSLTLETAHKDSILLR